MKLYKEYLYVILSFRPFNDEDGYIDEFYLEDKNKVLQYIRNELLDDPACG